MAFLNKFLADPLTIKHLIWLEIDFYLHMASLFIFSVQRQILKPNQISNQLVCLKFQSNRISNQIV
jgi:hypothetical protein